MKRGMAFITAGSFFLQQLSSACAMIIDEGEDSSSIQLHPSSFSKKSEDPDKELQQAVGTLKKAFDAHEVQGLSPDDLLQYCVKQEKMKPPQQKAYQVFFQAYDKWQEKREQLQKLQRSLLREDTLPSSPLSPQGQPLSSPSKGRSSPFYKEN